MIYLEKYLPGHETLVCGTSHMASIGHYEMRVVFMGVYFIQKSLVFQPFKGFSAQDECVPPENMTYVIIQVG